MAPLFPTTRRSVIVALASADEAERVRAFDALAALYWKPLYKYARVVRHRIDADAEDATQSFLARMYEQAALTEYDEERGSFRTYLRTLFDRHLANDWKAQTRIKRGGASTQLDFEAAESELERDRVPAASPEAYFQREWVRGVFTRAVERLRDDVPAIDFALFDAYDLAGARDVSYRSLAERFGVDDSTVTNRLASARRRFRAIVLDILRDVTVSDREFRDEVRTLLGIDA